MLYQKKQMEGMRGKTTVYQKKVGMQNQELNRRVTVLRVAVKFVLDVGGGNGGLDVYFFYFLFSCSFSSL